MENLSTVSKGVLLTLVVILTRCATPAATAPREAQNTTASTSTSNETAQACLAPAEPADIFATALQWADAAYAQPDQLPGPLAEMARKGSALHVLRAWRTADGRAHAIIASTSNPEQGEALQIMLVPLPQGGWSVTEVALGDATYLWTEF